LKIGIDGSFFSKKYEGGKEQVLMNLIKGLCNLGYGKDITVFGLEEAKDKFEDISEDINYVTVNMHKGFFKIKLFYGIWFRTFMLPKLVEKYEVDRLLFPVAYTGFSRFNIPTAVIPHDIQFKSNPSAFRGYENRIFHHLYGNDFKKREVIVAISDYDRDELKKHYGEYREKTRLIYNPIYFSDKFVPDKGSVPLSDGLPPEYIFANNMAYKHKNLKTLLKAYESIIDKTDCNLVISGSLYRDDEETNTLAERLKKSGRLVLTGYLPKSEFDKILKNARIFVNTSSFEGFGMSAVEAIYAEVTCLLADNSAVREVTLGRANYYCPAEDNRKLAEKLLQVLDSKRNPDFLRESSKLIEDKYDYMKISASYAELFKEMVR
jgi:glycosyltransferase involved in cell wall biosynthesis